jgi:hypothetical protein
MKPAIALIYFDGCPNVEPARAHLRRAIEDAGLDTEWQEWEQSDPSAPAWVKEHGSPTVLVDDRDVTGETAGVVASACRAGGAPSVETIRTALVEAA